MRQLSLVAPQTLEWLEVPEPTVDGPDVALLRPLAVAACDLDLPLIQGQLPFPLPIAIGHEFVGEVVELGEGVTGLELGQRVAAPFQISCGQCASCRCGHTSHCQAVPSASMYGFGEVGGQWGGALSDLLRVPFAESMLVPLPEQVEPWLAASAGDNMADAWRAVAPQLANNPGAPVLIVGGGLPSIGLYAVDMARALGASEVTYLDGDPGRLSLADALGATAIVAPPFPRFPRDLARCPITVDASRSHEGLAFALRATAPWGRCTSVSISFEPKTPIPLAWMYQAGIQFQTGFAQGRPPLPRILELIAEGRLRPQMIISQLVPWEDASEALRQPATKLVVSRLVSPDSLSTDAARRLRPTQAV